METILDYKSADFKSDQDVRWCPGCGDYSILAAIQRTMPKIGVKKEDMVFVSGIGCSSRFPYYMNTYGFHTIHGRAPAVATGVKLANPKLSVWMITGDGDALSIGGNHFIHLLRRNVNINVLLFNNEIYGLTKGQVSPTSRAGTKTKTSPTGSSDRPVNPTRLAAAAGATFVARTIDRDPKHMAALFEAAAAHQGTSFIEIYQNCVIFNDGVFESYSDKSTKDESMINLIDGQPLLFANGKKGIKIKNMMPVVVDINEQTHLDELYIHQEKSTSEIQTYMYSYMTESLEFPTPIGIFHRYESPIFEESIQTRADEIRAKKGAGSIDKLLHSGNTWTIDA